MLYTNSAAKTALLDILNHRNTWTIVITKQQSFHQGHLNQNCMYVLVLSSFNLSNAVLEVKQIKFNEIICEELLQDKSINSLHEAHTMQWALNLFRT